MAPLSPPLFESTPATAESANVSPEKASQVIVMLLGVPVSPGWVDKAAARLARQLREAGFDEAMEAALAAEAARARGDTTPDQGKPGSLRERYDKAAAFCVTITGFATGTRATTLGTPSPHGSRNTRSKCSCSPATSP